MDADHRYGDEEVFPITDNQVETWLKNDNKIGDPRVTRYASIECYSTFEQKKQVLNNCLRKVHEMANNDSRLRESATQKLAGSKGRDSPEDRGVRICDGTFNGTSSTRPLRMRG